MGQKTNPNILRKSQTSKWDSNYIEKKNNDLSLFTSKDLETRKLIYNFFQKNNLIIHSCKINYSNNNLLLIIKFQQSANSLNQIKTLNKIQNIRFKKCQNDIIVNKTKKKYNLLAKKIKNIINYTNFKYKTLLSKTKLVNHKIIKMRRIKILNYYKKFLTLRKNKTLKNLSSNSFLKPLFKSLECFYNNVETFTLILKPLNNNIFYNINKNQKVLLKKKLIKLKKYQRNDFFKEGVNLIFALLNETNSSELLATYISWSLKKLKRHNFFLRFLKTILTTFLTKTFTNLTKGIKIKIKGRLNGASRARHKKIFVGNRMTLLTINSNISYAEKTAFTSNGTIGVKVWVCEKA